MVVSGGSARLVNGILGLLCRQHFPGIVTYASKTESAYSFDHYVVASDAEYPNKAARVKAEFGVSLPGKEHCSIRRIHWTFLEIMNGYIAFVCRLITDARRDWRPGRSR